MNDWLEALREAGQGVLVTMAAARGSTPRETGARMLVTGDRVAGSVGGGNLEFRAIEIARQWLAVPARGARAELQRFPLGARLGQCCGGVADLLFERVDAGEPWVEALHAARARHRAVVLASLFGPSQPPQRTLVDASGAIAGAALAAPVREVLRALVQGRDDTLIRSVPAPDGRDATLFAQALRPSAFRILLFGAGHVARALVPVLGNLACSVAWVDEREAEFPDDLPSNVHPVLTAAPGHQVDVAAPGSFFLVMTHSHALDLELCERILRRGDFAYCGLIGSRAKQRRFDQRLRQRGIDGTARGRLVCPIGVAGAQGKRPGEIAVAVAAQLLIEHSRSPTPSAPLAAGAQQP